MTREYEDAAPAVAEALGELWDLAAEVEEASLFESELDVALALWRVKGAQCRRLIAVVAAAGRTRDLPPALLNYRDFLNAHDWRIPAP